MPFARSFALLLLCSLLTGAALCAIAAAFNPPRYSGAYAVIAAPETVSDRLLQERLAPLEAFSESTQWALLDEFGSVSRIPLDEYQGRVSGFDPRNDGYAEKLRSFFVHNSRRYVFIPVSGKSAVFEKRIAISLADIQYTLEYLGRKKPLILYFCLFAAAVFFLAIWYALKRSAPEAPPKMLGILLCLPLSAAFTFYGAPGFALAAVLLGLSTLLREPLRECCVLIRLYTGTGIPFAKKHCSFLLNVYEPFKLYWLLSPLFPAVFAAILVFSEIPPFIGALVFFAYTGLCFFSTWVFSAPRDSPSGASRRHIRFLPIPILRRNLPVAGMFVYILPFALASLLAVFLAPVFGMSAAAGLPAILGSPALVSEADYFEHTKFQYTFSRRPLGGGEVLPYKSYIMDTDGLLRPAGESVLTNTSEAPAEVPNHPFPLKGLMDFLASAAGTADMEANKTAILSARPAFGIAVRELLPAFFLLVLIIPSFFHTLWRRTEGSKRHPKTIIC